MYGIRSHSKVSQVAFALVLLAFLSGCATYRPARFPGQVIPRGDSEEKLVELQENINSRVYIKSGEILSGEICSLREDSIVIGKVGNFGLEKTEIPFPEIEAIEIEVNNSALGWIVGFVGGTGLIISCAVGAFLLFGDAPAGN